MQIKRITVDGKSYEVTPFSPREAIALEVRIESLLGPVIPTLKGLLGGAEVTSTVVEAIPSLISAAIDAVATKDPALNIVFDVLKKTAYKGSSGVSFFLDNDEAVETLFTGNHLGLFTLAWEVLKANGFFITKITGFLDTLNPQAKSLSPMESLTQASSENG